MKLDAAYFFAIIATGSAFGASLSAMLHLPASASVWALMGTGVCMGANLALCALNIGLAIKNWGKG